jgi:hypothetical protein
MRKEGDAVRLLRSLAGRVRAWWNSLRAFRLRPHLSTLVFLLPVVAVLVLANWPGWQVAYLNGLGFLGHQSEIDAHYEHGWPLTYLERRTWELSKTATVEYHSPWKLREGVLDFSLLALAADTVIGIGILALAAVLIEARRRRRHSCFQFHLRELLLFVTIVAIGLSFYAVRRKEYLEEYRIYQWLHRDENAADWTPLVRQDWPIEGPVWLLPIIGDNRYYELFARLWAVDASGGELTEVVKLRHLRFLRLGDASSDQLAPLLQMPKLEAIEFMYSVPEQSVELPPLPRLRIAAVENPTGSMSDIPNLTIKGLSALKSLEALGLRDDEFGDDEMAQLAGMTHLHWFSVGAIEGLHSGGHKITSAGIRHLEAIPELYFLDLRGTQVDDAVMPIFGRMKMLCYLNLSDTRVTDSGLESLKNLTGLRTLELDNTSITAEGVRRLQEALPDCRIQWSPRKPEDQEAEK